MLDFIVMQMSKGNREKGYRHQIWHQGRVVQSPIKLTQD